MTLYSITVKNATGHSVGAPSRLYADSYTHAARLYADYYGKELNEGDKLHIAEVIKPPVEVFVVAKETRINLSSENRG